MSSPSANSTGSSGAPEGVAPSSRGNSSGSASGFSGSYSPTIALSSSTRGSSFRSFSPK